MSRLSKIIFVCINAFTIFSSAHGRSDPNDDGLDDSVGCTTNGIISSSKRLINPGLNDKCVSYKVELSSRDKEFMGMDPSSTEVALEAKNKGLVPVRVFTIFSSPDGDSMSKKMPGNLNALVSSLFYNAAKENPNSPNNNYVFLKGSIADAFSGDKSKSKVVTTTKTRVVGELSSSEQDSDDGRKLRKK